MEQPTMKGWRTREYRARLKQDYQKRMAPIRAARKALRERQQAVREGREPVEIPGVEAVSEAPAVLERPDPDSMSRQDMIDYLKSQDVRGAHSMKDETLKQRVRNL